MKKVLILHGPNLNMLGKRPKNHYGSLTLNQINEALCLENNGFFELDFYQSNSEGEIISKIQEAINYFAILINPAAYTHTSVGIRDALEMVEGLKIEVHLSKVDQREDFRKVNFIRDICDACFSGKQVESYLEGLRYVKQRASK